MTNASNKTRDSLTRTQDTITSKLSDNRKFDNLCQSSLLPYLIHPEN